MKLNYLSYLFEDLVTKDYQYLASKREKINRLKKIVIISWINFFYSIPEFENSQLYYFRGFYRFQGLLLSVRVLINFCRKIFIDRVVFIQIILSNL